MVQVSYPGVYVQEIPSGFQAISGVSTSIAAFVGMAKRGPLLQPTRVLGFKDYERLFSADTSQGEMTEQVRQFFINKGEQAIIVRVALGADPSVADLRTRGGAVVLTLRSRDPGLDANQIRARVDYNTANPERTFNLTLYRETFDASGVPVVSAQETHADLGMNPNGPRYAKTIIDQQSQLVGATVNAPNVAAAATLKAFSASARIFTNDAAVITAFDQAIDKTGSAAKVGSFQIKVGNTPWLTVEYGKAMPFADIAARINTVIAQYTPVTVTAPSIPAGGGPLRIEASVAGNDVLIARSQQFDIAQELALGAAQGGIEVGTYAAARPAPSGLVSRIDTGTPGNLAALLEFGTADKAAFTSVGVLGVRPFAVLLANISYPKPAPGTMIQGTNAGNSLLNIRENLQAIANALSAGSPNWRAEVHGYRLALYPTFGGAAAGTGATFTSASPDVSTGNHIFNGITGAAAAVPLGGGDDGDAPQSPQYDLAYQAIDEKVDLFNLLVLPRSAGDTNFPSIRSTLWGAASAFCQKKRAFLIADLDLDVAKQTPDGVLQALPNLRAGVAKAYAGVWWPKVTIVSDGVRKDIDPSGSIAGVMARIDGSRGVWKAPAGLEADIRGVLGVQVPMSDQQNGLVNPEAVNAVRSFPAGVVSWGARTMEGFDNSGNTDYRYVPVRRFALYIEESLLRGLRFAVFEPNDEPLWAQIRLAAGAFMNGLFRRGAFAGRTTRESYFVKCDPETTTPQDQALGVVNVLVGFAPLRPAEFIVITVQQMAGQVQV